MANEDILRKAYSHAMSNSAIRYFDRDIDFMIVKNDMEEYLEKHNVDISEDELIEFIKLEFTRISEAMVDFTFNTRMMK